MENAEEKQVELLNSEMIWKIQKKSKLNSEKIGKNARKGSWKGKRYEKYGRNPS